MNNIVLDSIPSNGFGLRKTYEESILYFNVSSYLLNNVMCSSSCRKKLYVSNSGELVVENNNINSKDYREVDIIAFYPYRTNDVDYKYAIEVIDKEILHEHLVSEYVLLDKEGIEIDRFKSEEIPKIYGNYYSYKEEGKYNLCNYLRKSNHRYVFVPLFDEVVSSGSDIKNPNGDYINIINDRCFEFYLDGGAHRLYIDKDDNLEIFDYNKKIIV